MSSYGSRGPPQIEGMVSLKVDNLTYRTTPEDLRHAFEKYGEVGDVYIPRDRFTRESRGFAFVRFYDKRDAEDAMDSMDGAIFDGRELRVQTASVTRPRYDRTSDNNSYGRPMGSYGGGGGGRRFGGRGGGRDRGYGGGGGGYGRRGRSRSRSRDRRRRRSYSRSKSRSYSRSRSRSRGRKESRSRSRSGSKSPRRSRSRSRSKSAGGD